MVSQLHMGTPAGGQTQDNTEFRSSDPARITTFAGLEFLEQFPPTAHTHMVSCVLQPNNWGA